MQLGDKSKNYFNSRLWNDVREGATQKPRAAAARRAHERALALDSEAGADLAHDLGGELAAQDDALIDALALH